MQVFKLVTLMLIVLLVGCKKDDHNDNPVQPQPVDTWVKTYANLGFGSGGVVQTRDGGFAVNVWENSLQSSSKLMRLDATGDSVWLVNFPKYSTEGITSLIETRNGDLVFAGYVGADIYVGRVSATGELLWEFSYNRGSGNDQGADIVETTDEGFLVCGSLANRFGVLKIDQSGDSLWERTLSDSAFGTAHAIDRAVSGNYVIVGGVGGSAQILTMSADGELGWERRISESGTRVAMDLQPLADGSTIVLGNTGTEQAWATKLSPEGIPVWSNLYGEHGRVDARSLSRIHDGAYVVVGSIRPNDGSMQNILLFQLRDDGSEGWSQQYLTSLEEHGIAISSCTDGGYLVSSMMLLSGGQHDLLLLKVDQNGEL
jgi:hypothetical protein